MTQLVYRRIFTIIRVNVGVTLRPIIKRISVLYACISFITKTNREINCFLLGVMIVLYWRHQTLC